MQLYFVKMSALTIALLASLLVSKSQNQASTKDFKLDFWVEPDEQLFSVSITCFNNLWTNFPEKHYKPFVLGVAFLNCSFPATVNVQNLIHSIDIDFFSQVTFSQFGSVPSRQNLKGLSTHHLKFENIDFTVVSFDLLYDTNKIGFLGIRSAHLASIPEQFFRDWAKDIMELSLHDNVLRTIRAKDFVQLVNVNLIDLSYNEIEMIEPGAFDGLIHLYTVKLGFNKLRTLPSNIFHQTTSLLRIGLNNNAFDKLPHNLLVNTKKLITFAMNNNMSNSTTLAPGLFKNLTYLELVTLYSNQIEHLPADLFAGCSALRYVSFKRNKLRNIPSGFFDDNVKLEYLLLDENRLESLPAGIFKNLNRLRFLYINGNRLTSLTSENLKGLDEILIFNASRNKLTRLDYRFIENLKYLDGIDLSHNMLTLDGGELERDLSELLNKLDGGYYLIRKLNLSYNCITKFNPELIDVMKFNDFVDLSHNLISKINLSELSSGFARYNNITNTFKSVQVRIRVSGNPLHCDCSVTDLVNYLNRYDDDNGIPYRVIADSFVQPREGFLCLSPPEFKNREIRGIHLAEPNCLLKAAAPEDACYETCTCREYTGIQVFSVDCSHRNLTRVPPLIENVHNWSINLNMSGNFLQQTPSLRDSYLTYVTTLDLSNNNVARVTLDLFSPKLQHLKLHGNNISRLDSDVIHHLTHDNTLCNLTLHNNKWICDCKARELIKFVKNKFTTYGFGEMGCYGTDRELDSMTDNELCEDTIATIIVASSSVAIFGILVASLVALYYKYQCEIKFWLYSKQWCLWFVTEDELDKDKEYDAFISFSNKDEDFVEKEIIAKLEGGLKPYKLCLHYRDWLAGEWIPVQINRSVAESRRTIVILTPNFLESLWGLIEFRTAHIQALKEGIARLIVIIHGDIGNIDDLDQEMKDYLRLNTYIKWGDPWFWDKLRYALPHAKKKPWMRKSQKIDIVNKHPTQSPVTNTIDTHGNEEDEVISMTIQTTSINDPFEAPNPCTEIKNLMSSNL